MSIELRPYQANLVERARDAVIDGKRRILIQLMMGGGKTIIAKAIMEGAFKKGFRSIFLAHRRELVKQTAQRFEQYGLSTTILMNGYEFDPNAQVVIASQQTWESRRDFLDREYAVMVVDEAHIGVERQRRIFNDIAESNPDLVVIGLTATPMTNSGIGLGSIYQHLIQGPTLDWLTKHGYLVPAEHYMMQPLDFKPEDLIALNSSGEYDEQAVMEWFKEWKVMGDIITTYTDNFMGKQFIVFARSIEHSVYIATKFGEHGIPVAHIDFRTPEEERNRILEAFRKGEIVGLSNVDIFSEGFDMPAIEVAILATPMRSITRYIQRVGRVLRPAPGKEKATIVDHGGVLQEHGTIYNYQQWVLEPARPLRLSRAHALKPRREMYRTCPICGKTFKAGKRKCPECGYDFHYLPPGHEPPMIPAVLVEYEEQNRIQDEIRAGKRRCRGVKSIPPGYNDVRLMAEILGFIKQRNEERKPDKKPLSEAFADILFYSIRCVCPREIGVNRYQIQPVEPGDFIRSMWRRYWYLKSKGYFSGEFPCWKKRGEQ